MVNTNQIRFVEFCQYNWGDIQKRISPLIVYSKKGPERSEILFAFNNVFTLTRTYNLGTHSIWIQRLKNRNMSRRANKTSVRLKIIRWLLELRNIFSLYRVVISKSHKTHPPVSPRQRRCLVICAKFNWQWNILLSSAENTSRIDIN